MAIGTGRHRVAVKGGNHATVQCVFVSEVRRASVVAWFLFLHRQNLANMFEDRPLQSFTDLPDVLELGTCSCALMLDCKRGMSR